MTDHKKSAQAGAVTGKELFFMIRGDETYCSRCYASGVAMELLARALVESDASTEYALDYLAKVMATILAILETAEKGADHYSPPKFTDKRKLI